MANAPDRPHRRPGRGRTAVVAVAVAAAGLAGCSDGGPGDAGDGTGTSPVYVAVGASETVGVGADDPSRQAWTVLFHEQALPEAAEFVNLGVSGSNTAEALAAQVPRAVELAPTLVTVWLNVNDIVDRVAPAQYERQLAETVRRLRRGGRTKVLVANTPEVDQLPVLARFGGSVTALADQAVDAYNEVTARVVEREGAVLVDLHAASERAERDGRFAELISADGFHPSTQGHAEVASLFEAALESSGGLGTG
ncbi:MAG TPA: SGNH/GDSL hydrolase family protein [Acidimicrobiales bacterium]|nr:SGNH/GDSL hydrolase family protein [Acidimicrobiales bacterium]